MGQQVPLRVEGKEVVNRLPALVCGMPAIAIRRNQSGEVVFFEWRCVNHDGGRIHTVGVTRSEGKDMWPATASANRRHGVETEVVEAAAASSATTENPRPGNRLDAPYPGRSNVNTRTLRRS